MAIKFEFYQSPNPTGSKKKRYHARVVSTKQISTDELAEEIHSACTLTVADIRATIISLSHSLAEHLRNGEKVHIDGIGYFQPTLKCPETRTPSATRAQQVKFKSVKYRADIKLTDQIKTAHTERSRVKSHSAVLSNIEIDMKLTKHFLTNPVLTRRDMERLCRFTTSTAGRHMVRLVKEGRLKNINTYRNPIYVPVPGNYGVQSK